MRTISALAVAAFAALTLTACADPQPAEVGGGGGGPSSGAHAAHVAAGPFANAYACGTCHDSQFAVVFPTPPPGDPPNPARAQGASPSFSAASATCSNVYCHAGGPSLPLGGGTVPQPVWDPKSTVQCGACHGLPPTGHVALSPGQSCGDCHAGYTATSVNKAVHINGQIDLGGSGGIPTSGAHTIHLQGSALASGFACTQCHGAVPQVVFPPPSLAQSNGASPSFSTSTKGCSNVYCHVGGTGAGNVVLGGGTVPVPIWNPPGTVACGACHALPGGATATPWHPDVVASVDCGLCHTGFTRSSVDKAVHVNGQANVKAGVAAGSCTACHGDATKTATQASPLYAAPPVARTPAAVGAHQAHLTGTSLRNAPIPCSECHQVPGDLSHVGPALDTPATLSWGTLARTDGASPTFTRASATCSSTYCHGGTLTGGGTNKTPVWTGASSQVACGTCHAIPPAGTHTNPSVHQVSCSFCHGGTYTSTAVDTSLHLNGAVNVSASATIGWNPATRNCTNACHGGGTEGPWQ